jgi:hypothetical protein
MIQIQIKCTGQSTYLLYKVSEPTVRNELEDDFNIVRDGSFMIKVRNPLISTRERGKNVGEILGLKPKADYPEQLQALFAGTRVDETCWTNAVPAFMNFEHSELLLMTFPTADLKSQFESFTRLWGSINECTPHRSQLTNRMTPPSPKNETDDGQKPFLPIDTSLLAKQTGPLPHT